MIPDFMKHEAIIRNQFSALKYLKHNMDDNEALLQMDFSENYSLKHVEEILSFQFGGSRKQVTLHTSSLLMKDNAYEPLKVKSLQKIFDMTQQPCLRTLSQYFIFFKMKNQAWKLCTYWVIVHLGNIGIKVYFISLDIYLDIFQN